MLSGMRSAMKKAMRARMERAGNANICEPGPESDTAGQPDSTLQAGSDISQLDTSFHRKPLSAADSPGPDMHQIFRIQFAGFDRVAYQAMEDTLLIASNAVQARFVPIDPVSMALGAAPDVLVINLNHPDASQLGKTLRPAPGVPVVWVSIPLGQPQVGQPDSPLYKSLLQGLQGVVNKRDAAAAQGGTISPLRGACDAA